MFSLSSNWQDADDITQEALLKAFRAFSTFDGRASLSTWLYAVARSVSIDWHRSRLGQAAQREKSSFEYVAAQPAPQLQQDEACSLQQQREQLWRAIRRLEERYRVPLVLFEIEGLSYEEIAAIEAVPVGTIRSRLSRAREELRELVRETWPESGVHAEHGQGSLRRFHG